MARRKTIADIERQNVRATTLAEELDLRDSKISGHYNARRSHNVFVAKKSTMKKFSLGLSNG